MTTQGPLPCVLDDILKQLHGVHDVLILCEERREAGQEVGAGQWYSPILTNCRFLSGIMSHWVDGVPRAREMGSSWSQSPSGQVQPVIPRDGLQGLVMADAQKSPSCKSGQGPGLMERQEAVVCVSCLHGL